MRGFSMRYEILKLNYFEVSGIGMFEISELCEKILYGNVRCSPKEVVLRLTTLRFGPRGCRDFRYIYEQVLYEKNMRRFCMQHSVALV